MKTLDFTCPNCGNHKFEEILSNATVITKINSVTIDDDGVPIINYGTQTNEDGEVNRYQCSKCGKSLGVTVKDEESLVEWLEEQEEIQRRDEKNGLYPDSTDPAN